MQITYRVAGPYIEYFRKARLPAFSPEMESRGLKLAEDDREQFDDLEQF